MYGRLMGLNRNQVDDYLENLNKTSQERIEFAKERIKLELEENSKLQLLLDKLKTEKETYLSQEKYIEASKKRLKDTLLALDKVTSEEIEKNLSSIKDKLSSYDKRLELAKKEIQTTRSNIDELFHKIKGALQEEKKAEPEEEFDFSDDSRNNIKLLPFLKEKPKNETSEEPIGNEIVLDLPKEAIKEDIEEDVSYMKKSENQKVTADGLSIKDLDKISANLGHQPSRISKKLEINEDIIPKKEFNGFWSDSDSSYKTMNANADNIIAPEAIIPTNSITKKDPISEIYQGGSSGIPLFVKPEAAPTVNSIPPRVPQPDTAAASPTVAKEIELIRHRYIVGKLSGEDMYDSEGRLIISKNTVITPEIIVKAETEGKLPDLIVNMILPGI